MITVKFQGGVGNNLFQAATTFAFGLKHKVDVVFPTIIDNPHYEGQQVHRFPGFKYSDNIIPLPIFQEQQFHYKPIPFMDYVCLSGYWQSWRYFDQYRKELLEALWFKYEKKEGCAIHVRRGDYLDKPEIHPPITYDYIFASVSYMIEKGCKNFKFFSDDIDWCIEQSYFYPDDVHKKIKIEFSKGKTEIEDLQEMSCYEHQITSNSSFGWWAAYLNQNPNKIVISPRRWFGLEYRHQNTRDLYLPNSVIL